MLEGLAQETSALLAAPDRAPDRLSSLVPNSSHCRVCRLLRETELTYTRHLADFLKTEEGRKAYAGSQGLCLRHLGLLIAAVPAEAIRRFLLSEAARHFKEVAEEMRSFATKRDTLNRALLNQDEEDAYIRGVVRVVGERRMCAPWKQDGPV